MWLHGYTVQDSVPTQDYQVLELRNPMVETPPTTPTQWTPPTGTSPSPSQIRTLKAEFIFLMYLSLDKFH